MSSLFFFLSVCPSLVAALLPPLATRRGRAPCVFSFRPSAPFPPPLPSVCTYCPQTVPTSIRPACLLPSLFFPLASLAPSVSLTPSFPFLSFLLSSVSFGS
ncbi:hypothetical protein DFJ73DRAFT_819993 [Zopfochytrium polystomum]|nr:hypothetical protein DFJ73DRAFT_819993 [Zopfochytrium polystomum]